MTIYFLIFIYGLWVYFFKKPNFSTLKNNFQPASSSWFDIYTRDSIVIEHHLRTEFSYIVEFQRYTLILFVVISRYSSLADNLFIDVVEGFRLIEIIIPLIFVILSNLLFGFITRSFVVQFANPAIFERIFQHGKSILGATGLTFLSGSVWHHTNTNPMLTPFDDPVSRAYQKSMLGYNYRTISDACLALEYMRITGHKIPLIDKEGFVDFIANKTIIDHHLRVAI